MDVASDPPKRKRGPAPRISREAVLAVARDLPEERLTMAAISAELGVTAGALYRYFPDRAAVVDALAVDGRDALDPPSTRLGWREWLEEAVQLERRFWNAHPELRDSAARMAATRPALHVLEAGLEVLTRDGFSPANALAAIIAAGHVALALSQVDLMRDVEADPELTVDATALLERFGLEIDRVALSTEVVDIMLAGVASRLGARTPG